MRPYDPAKAGSDTNGKSADLDDPSLYK